MQKQYNREPGDVEPQPEGREAAGTEEAYVIGMDIRIPKPQSVLRIGPHGPDMEVMLIESPYPYPGPLRRLAYWILLGWKWERP